MKVKLNIYYILVMVNLSKLLFIDLIFIKQKHPFLIFSIVEIQPSVIYKFYNIIVQFPPMKKQI